MRFLADMGVSWRVVEWLRDNGHDAIHLREQQLHRLPNGGVFAKAADEQRIILTWDLDFTEIVALSNTRIVSAIVFCLLNTRSTNVIRRLARVLTESVRDLEEGAVISVEESRHRVRLLPIGRER
jgi:predicted nuclease of predicted toxin-antitoxin system